MTTGIHYQACCALCVLILTACGKSNDGNGRLEVPDEFDAPFVTGRVCMPSKVQTGTSGQTNPVPAFPLRIETCIYRCIAIQGSTVTYYSQCAGNQCMMTLLAYGHALRVPGEQNCDANELPAPDSSECTNETFDFTLEPPGCGNAGCDQQVPKGAFNVSVPYLDQQQGQDLLTRLNRGESLVDAARTVVGTQSYPSRQFVVNFDPSNPAVSGADALTDEDCHEIAQP
ncbi:MAG TPA: hypothetical protein VIV60_03175 [Polyangiaceae bacterium]